MKELKFFSPKICSVLLIQVFFWFSRKVAANTYLKVKVIDLFSAEEYWFVSGVMLVSHYFRNRILFCESFDITLIDSLDN